MPVYQLGSINTTALIVPDLYVQIVPPQIALLNGVPTNILGIVGTASWGPVNNPTDVGSMAQYSSIFGPIKARKYDLGTAAALAVLQGAQALKCVRVTDGTDAAASIILTATGTAITFTSKWTGSLGNSIQVGIGNGAKTGSYRVTVSIPGAVPEAFDNITGTGTALWQAMADAINLGQSGLRGPSQIIVASAGVGTGAPTVAVSTLSGGTDGATTITGSVLVGNDAVPRTGMYALRGQFVSVGVLADCDDNTTWALQVAFGLFEGVYMMLVGLVGESIASAVTAKSTAGIDSYAAKLMLGDYVYWLDTVNGQQRLVSPQAIVGGLLSNLSPQNSSLNKPLYGIVGTQKSASGLAYTSADLQTLALAGIDVIANPVPGGSYFGVRIGHNSSSSPVTQGDNYTRMTNYIAATLNRGMGIYVGKLQTPTVRKNAKATLDAFFSGLYQQNMIGTASGTSLPWQTILDDSNNPPTRVALGYMQADVQVIYLSVIEKFIINVEGGQSVQISRVSTQLNA
jgi:hypothetical protein